MAALATLVSRLAGSSDNDAVAALLFALSSLKMLPANLKLNFFPSVLSQSTKCITGDTAYTKENKTKHLHLSKYAVFTVSKNLTRYSLSSPSLSFFSESLLLWGHSLRTSAKFNYLPLVSI